MTQEVFVPRQEKLENLRKRVAGFQEGYRQNIALIGDELVGKTTLLHAFLKSQNNPRLIHLYLEIKYESQISFIRRFVGVLLYNFLRQRGIPLAEDLDYLLAEARRLIPKTAERMSCLLNTAQRRRKQGLFGEILHLTTLIHQENGKYCLVIFDEFHNLEHLGFRGLYRDWSSMLMTQKTTMYIISSSVKFKAREILAKNLDLLFGNFEVITVEPFDIRTSERLLGEALKGRHYPPGLRNFIVHFTGGYPLYLKIVTRALEGKEVKDFPEILDNLLFDTSGILHQRFSNYLRRFHDRRYSKDYLCILYLISSGRNKIHDLTHILHKPRKDILARVNHLMELDTVIRCGDFLMITDRLFSFWMRFVYEEKLHALTIDAHHQKARFRDAVASLVRDFSLCAKKPLNERLIELLHSFEDEMVQMDRKRIRLNHFREVKSLEFENKRVREGILGRSHDSLWILALKKASPTEHDVAAFARECRKYRRYKLQRKIIVTMADEIDTNTRLCALEEKIWTWDINKVNYMLDLFHKPRIMVNS